MLKIFLMVAWGLLGLIAATTFFRARVLSVQYNASTRKLRVGDPRILPPQPTPRMLELNTTIMTWVIRVVGGSVFIYCTAMLMELLP